MRGHSGESLRGEFYFVSLEILKAGEFSFYGCGIDRAENRHLIDWWIEYQGIGWLPGERGDDKETIIDELIKHRKKAAKFLKVRIATLGGEEVAFKLHGVKVDVQGLCASAPTGASKKSKPLDKEAVIQK